MAEHPAEAMRRAAARLREASANATPPPWRVAFLDGVTPLVDGPGHMVAKMHRCGHPEHEERAKADAALAALLRNASEALAGWLEEQARHAEHEVRTGSGWHTSCAGYVTGQAAWNRLLCNCWDGALATARAILGEGQ